MEAWYEQRQKLQKLIKKLSDQYGGDDPEFLASYTQEVIKKYASTLEVAIVCFGELTN